MLSFIVNWRGKVIFLKNVTMWLIERGSVPMESVSSISLFSKTFPLSVSSCVDSA